MSKSQDVSSLVDEHTFVQDSVSVPSGAPGLAICGAGLELFTGVIQNTGTGTINMLLETLGGQSLTMTVPSGGKFTVSNRFVKRLQTTQTATISILGTVALYKSLTDWFSAFNVGYIDVSGVFSATVPTSVTDVSDRAGRKLGVISTSQSNAGLAIKKVIAQERSGALGVGVSGVVLYTTGANDQLLMASFFQDGGGDANTSNVTTGTATNATIVPSAANNVFRNVQLQAAGLGSVSAAITLNTNVTNANPGKTLLSGTVYE